MSEIVPANLPTGGSYLPGDANLDGVVDGSDFGRWNSHRFTATSSWCEGDFSADGVVDGTDFGIWNSNKFKGSLGTPGDFNGDSFFDCADISLLTSAVANHLPFVRFDLNEDGTVNLADVHTWLAIAGAHNLPSGASYLPGDANLDGLVDGTDFGIWNSHKFTSSPSWCDGDFNADGVVDGSDFGIWNTNKFVGVPGLTGDLNGDGQLSCLDINLLTHAVASNDASPQFDLNTDSHTDLRDVHHWLAIAGRFNLPSQTPYLPGDANLDGVVDGSDFGRWNANKFTARDAWCDGDFTADGVVDGSDFGTWNSNKFTTSDDAGKPWAENLPLVASTSINLEARSGVRADRAFATYGSKTSPNVAELNETSEEFFRNSAWVGRPIREPSERSKNTITFPNRFRRSLNPGEQEVRWKRKVDEIFEMTYE